MGRELATRFERKPASIAADKKRGGLVFDSPKRLNLFTFLCIHPCSTVQAISRKLGISNSATRWHLEKLKSGFVTTHKVGKFMVAAPANMLADSEIRLFTALSSESGRKTYLALSVERRALTLRELIHATGLERKKLLSLISVLAERGMACRLRDGRFIRYSISGIETIDGRFAGRKLSFRNHVIARLADEGYEVKIESGTSSSTLLWLVSRRKKHLLLLLSTAPYKTILK